MARAVTVRVYHDAIASLADDISDPVVQILEGLTEEVREVALENARKIIPSLPDGFLSIEAGKDTKGLYLRIEPDGGGKLSSYLTWKEIREHAWFEPAVSEVIGFGSVRMGGGF